jgi:hypothetical protein
MHPDGVETVQANLEAALDPVDPWRTVKHPSDQCQHSIRWLIEGVVFDPLAIALTAAASARRAG